MAFGSSGECKKEKKLFEPLCKINNYRLIPVNKQTPTISPSTHSRPPPSPPPPPPLVQMPLYNNYHGAPSSTHQHRPRTAIDHRVCPRQQHTWSFSSFCRKNLFTVSQQTRTGEIATARSKSKKKYIKKNATRPKQQRKKKPPVAHTDS